MSMEKIIIQEYTPSDWASIEIIHDEARKNELALAGLEEAFIPLKEAAVNEGLFDYSVRVARIGGDTVGFVAFSADEVAWVYTHPAHSRKGIGRALVQHALASIIARPVQVEVMQGNTPAILLYESLGFSTVEKVTGAMPGNEGFSVTVHRMEKK